MWVAIASIGIFAVGLTGWAANTDVAGAVIAHGVIVVEGGSKRIQHQEGGLVSAIFARNEDVVEAGAVLLRLDGTATNASLAIIDSQLAEALALEARLTAESAGTHEMVRPNDPLVTDALFDAQRLQKETRTQAREAINEQIDEQVKQIQVQISGIDAERTAVEQQLSIVSSERDDLNSLLVQGLVVASRSNALVREVARLEGERGRLVAEAASARVLISQKSLEIEQGNAAFLSTILEDLQATRQKIAELRQQKVSAEDRLARLDVRAPQAGIVHESKVQTVGGVIGPGETIMMIVPQTDDLAVEAKVSPMDVDKLHSGQPVAIKLSSLDSRRTPELQGTLRSVSPDLTQDPQTGQSFYTAKVNLPADELAKLPAKNQLVPGMPAEVFVQMGDRTVLAYLIRPLAEQLSLALREPD